jgi:hypothetical protein
MKKLKTKTWFSPLTSHFGSLGLRMKEEGGEVGKAGDTN